MQEQDKDLLALKALAQAATPGPWYWCDDALMAGKDYILWPNNVLNAVDGIPLTWAERLGSCGNTTEPCAEANASLIAVANPAAILSLISRIEQAEAALADMEARKDVAYDERNQVVAALAKCFRSGVARTAIEGWSEDWHGCVYIDLPTGQASWHFHDSQAHLFNGLPQYEGKWDGHDTPEKYRRVNALKANPTPAVDLGGLTNGKFVLMPRSPSEAVLQPDGWPRLEYARYQAMLDEGSKAVPQSLLSAPVVREGKMTDKWLPTAENVNALPEGVRRYVHDLEARCDPAGDVAALTGLRDQLDGVQIMYRKAADALDEVRGCFRAAEVEGLSTVLAETADERLEDLVERRLMYALYAAEGVEREVLATGKQDAEPVPTTAIYSSELATEGYRPFGPGEPLLPERDPSKPAEQQGLFRKFEVRRVDGSDQPGGKHEGCRYFVLDLNHDQHAPAAMRAYAVACESTHPQLAADLKAEFGEATPSTPSQAWEGELPEPRAIRAGHSFPKVYAMGYTADQMRESIGAAVAGVRDKALEEAAQVVDALGDAKFGGEKLDAAIECFDAIRSLSSNPVSLTEKAEQQPFAYLPKSELAKLDYPRVAARGMYVFKEPGEGRVAIYLAPHPASNGNGEKGGDRG